MIVVDTNVVSELMRPAPADTVIQWFDARDPATLYLTAMTVAEILYALERLPSGRRKGRLRQAATEVFAAFPDHILPFDADAARRYAEVVTRRDRSGRPISALDAQLAAICRAHGAELATRNVDDFAGTGVAVANPFVAR